MLLGDSQDAHRRLPGEVLTEFEEHGSVALVLQPGAALDPVELMQYCEEHMAYFMIPRYVRVVDAFPKTGTERTMKYQLKSQGVTPDTWDRETAGYTPKRQM